MKDLINVTKLLMVVLHIISFEHMFCSLMVVSYNSNCSRCGNGLMALVKDKQNLIEIATSMLTG